MFFCLFVIVVYLLIHQWRNSNDLKSIEVDKILYGVKNVTVGGMITNATVPDYTNQTLG